MKLFLSFLFSVILLSASAQKEFIVTKDSAFKQVKKLLENHSYVAGGSVYRIYDMNLKECTLEYKVYIEDQDDIKGKVSTHRSYVVNLSQLQPGFTKKLDNQTNWLVLKANAGATITESILPEPKKKAIPKPYVVRDIAEVFIPIDSNNSKYSTAFNRLIAYCRN